MAPNAASENILIIEVPGRGTLLVPSKTLEGQSPDATVEDLLRQALRFTVDPANPDGPWKPCPTSMLNEMD